MTDPPSSKITRPHELVLKVLGPLPSPKLSSEVPRNPLALLTEEQQKLVRMVRREIASIREKDVIYAVDF